jgi:uncharacterized membrane protein YgcG
MTRRPSDPRDPGVSEGSDPVISELEAYISLTAAEHPHGLADRVMAAVAEEPTPRHGFLAGLLASLRAGREGGMTRMVLVAGTMALAVLAVVVAGQLGNLFRDSQIGPSPLPSAVESAPSVTESPTPSPTPSDRPSRSPRPSPSDDESPDPSGSPDDDDERETPEPSDDDNSGPSGGGGGDSSGPGGGGSGSNGDSSGSGSGDGSG